MSLRPNAFVVTVVIFVNLAAIMCGLQTGGINGILEMDGFKDTFSHLYQNDLTNGSSTDPGCSAGNGADSDSLIGIIVSSSHLGSAAGSLIAGWLSDQFSRKYSLAISGVVMAIGSGVMAASYYVWMLIVGRTLTGIAIGIFYMVMSVYIAEVSPKESRGMLGSTIGPTFMAGVTVALLANIGFAKFSIGWRLANVVLGIVGVIYAIGMAFLPYTPRWLVKKGRDNQALEVLMKINHHSNKETCVDTYMELEQLREATRTDSKEWRGKLKEIFQKKYRLLMCCTIFFMEAAVALMIYTYSTTIFCEVNINGFYASLVVGLVSVAGATISIGLVDRVGRKAILLTGVGTNFVSGLAITILIHVYASPSEAVKYIIVILICIYAFAISSSWLTIPWIVNSEIFPINIRGIAVSISTSQYWFSAFLIIQLLPLIVGSPRVQLHGLFYIVSAINLTAFIFVLFVLPETKGVSLEQMDQLFTQSIWQRFVGTFKCPSSQQEEKQVTAIRQGKTLSHEEKKQNLSFPEEKLNDSVLGLPYKPDL